MAWEIAPFARSSEDLVPILVRVLVALPRSSPWRHRVLIALADLRPGEGLPTPGGMGSDAGRPQREARPIPCLADDQEHRLGS